MSLVKWNFAGHPTGDPQDARYGLPKRLYLRKLVAAWFLARRPASDSHQAAVGGRPYDPEHTGQGVKSDGRTTAG